MFRNRELRPPRPRSRSLEYQGSVPQRGRYACCGKAFPSYPVTPLLQPAHLHSFAIAFFYGAWRVSVGAYTGGKVLQVLVAALLGGFSLGQVRCTGRNLGRPGPSVDNRAGTRAAGQGGC